MKTQTNSDMALDLYRQAVDHAKAGRMNEAIATIGQSLSIEETGKALHDAGVFQYMTGNLPGAIFYLERAVMKDPQSHSAYGNLARIAFEMQQLNKAILYSSLAVTTGPQVLSYKEDFLRIMRNKGLLVFYPQVRDALLVCLQADDLPHQDLQVIWISVIEQDPALADLQSLLKQNNYRSFRKAFARMKNLAALFDPVLLYGLRRLYISKPNFELFITHLRHFILDAYAAGDFHKFGEAGPVLAETLAIYCFYTDYIFVFDDDERKAIEELKQAVESGAKTDPVSLCILGMYVPLASLANAQSFAQTEPAELIRIQINEPLEERAIRTTIPALTSIENGVSTAVREQYEEFPYPRWKTIAQNEVFTPLAEPPPPESRILIAGCGTGQDAAVFARIFPQAGIEAVDLSLSSLSYAIRMARKIGLNNISFHQADILKLDFDRQFDIINSTGVLHHMQDPEAGWSVLTRLLKPGGLMCIALYSERARKEMVAARDVIARKGIKNDRDSIRAFRSNIDKLMKKQDAETLRHRRDFYNMAECRDLLFHVQEFRYTLPQVQDMIARQGLTFLGFNLPPETMADYKALYPSDPKGLNLENWERYERAKPYTFFGMYHFWCRKAA